MALIPVTPVVIALVNLLFGEVNEDLSTTEERRTP